MGGLRIHVLGPLRVVRADGSVVEPHEWRTAKTMDLVRILALADGQPTSVTTLVERLWPDVPYDRARVSLRTAASQARRTIGVPCVRRHHDGLALEDAWVDVREFRRACRAVRSAWETGDADRALAAAEVAQDLWRGSFVASDQDSGWATSEREALDTERRRMLCEAAECAESVARYDLAVELARHALVMDASAERAYRTIMRAHAALGEVGTALLVFERCRHYLTENLGATPSPQTRMLHLQLLRHGAAES
ncbi:bacterial transcriptional activator domain-containing protein [Nocardioides sp. C4-1]|uniref:AfsR/SARP family transcriptional regulator n=1 Tax=Nocardioides sp. C4-1 TaxID=3151851 RepID=UPI0032635929